eukprot:3171046-Karenia_brevis.AAC.1
MERIRQRRCWQNQSQLCNSLKDGQAHWEQLAEACKHGQTQREFLRSDLVDSFKEAAKATQVLSTRLNKELGKACPGLLAVVAADLFVNPEGFPDLLSAALEVKRYIERFNYKVEDMPKSLKSKLEIILQRAHTSKMEAKGSVPELAASG